MTRFRITREMYESAAVGTVVTFMGLGLSAILDRFTSLELSNMAGLLFEGVLDYFGQKKVFDPTSKMKHFRTTPFVISKLGAIGLTQLIFLGFMWELGDAVSKNSLTLQVLRLVSAAIAWVPHFIVRKYWVFI